MAVVGFKSTRINAKRLIEHIHLKHSLDNLLAHALQYFFLATRIFQIQISLEQINMKCEKQTFKIALFKQNKKY